MSLKIMMDVHVRREITVGLRLRGVDVVTAQQDESHRLSDPELLDRAQELGCVLFSQDSDLLVEAVRRQRAGETFNGVVYVPQLAITIGRCIADLEMIAKVYEPQDMVNRVEYLPLK